VQGKTIRLVLTMTNHADGTATGTILSVDSGGMEIPIAVTQKTVNVTIEVAAVGGSFTGVLHAATELVGTWTQGPATLPLTFTRAGK